MSNSSYQKLSPDEERILKEALEGLKTSLESELRSWSLSHSLSSEEVEIQEDIQDIDNLLRHLRDDQIVILD